MDDIYTAKHVVVGAGPLGSAVARELLARGHHVAVVSRSTAGPEGTDWIRADVSTDTGFTQGAAVVYQCAQPPYHLWHKGFAELQRAVIADAARIGAAVVIADNLYGYGTGGGGVITESSPIAPVSRKGELRVRMAGEALAAHRDGKARVALCRPSTYIGGGYEPFDRSVARPILAGKTAQFLGRVDQPHSFSFVPDAARAMVAVGTSDVGWGRAWITPVLATMTARELADALWSAAGHSGSAKVSGLGKAGVATLGLAIPALRASVEMLYEFTEPHVVDASAFTSTFGVEATSLSEAATLILAR